jgi:ketosteroid isomerase-like protein
MRREVLCAAAVLVLWSGVSYAQSANDQSARDSLLKTDIEWSQSAASRDVERIVSFWTDDAVIYSPREPAVVGKAAIRQFVTESLKQPAFSISWKPTEAVVAGSGDLGYTMGTNTITFPDPQGKVVTSQGRYVTVWRKESAGRWRCVVDFWNEAPQEQK